MHPTLRRPAAQLAAITLVGTGLWAGAAAPAVAAPTTHQVTTVAELTDALGCTTATAGDTVQLAALIADLPATSVDCSLTLDLNGFDLTGARLQIGDTFTITDESSAEVGDHGQLELVSSSGAAIRTTGAQLTIAGGNITARGGMNGAGIGGDFGGDGGEVTITGGTVDARGSVEGAGIGGGYTRGSGKVTITGGTVTATGGGDAAGIGSGCSAGVGGEVTITGGTVTATGGSGGAGIGGGLGGPGGTLTISGGTIDAQGGNSGAGIGGGSNGNAGTVGITGGDLTARGGNNAAGIGGNGGTVGIGGGDITAQGGTNAAGIGGGSAQPGSAVTISSGIVTAIPGNQTGGTIPPSAVGAGTGGTQFGSLEVSGDGVLRLPSGQLVVPDSNASAPEIIISGDGLVTGSTDDPPTYAQFSGAGQIQNDGRILMPASSLAGTTVDGNNYRLTFDLNGASGTEDPITVYAATLALADTALPTPGAWGNRTFLNWNTATDGTGDTVENSTDLETITDSDGTVTLFARWALLDQQISAPTPPTNTTVGTVHRLTATSDSGLPVDYTVVPGSAEVCTLVLDNLLILTSAGECEVLMDQPGDPTHNPAAQVTYTFTVTEPSSVPGPPGPAGPAGDPGAPGAQGPAGPASTRCIVEQDTYRRLSTELARTSTATVQAQRRLLAARIKRTTARVQHRFAQARHKRLRQATRQGRAIAPKRLKQAKTQAKAARAKVRAARADVKSARQVYRTARGAQAAVGTALDAADRALKAC